MKSLSILIILGLSFCASDKTGYEWYPVLAAENCPDPIPQDGKPTDTIHKKYRVYVKTGNTPDGPSGEKYSIAYRSINGEPFDEPFLEEEYVSTYGDSFMEDVEPVTLAENEYYCLGDNRPHSSDSRYYGPFKKDEIECRGVFIIYPFSNFGAKTW